MKVLVLNKRLLSSLLLINITLSSFGDEVALRRAKIDLPNHSNISELTEMNSMRTSSLSSTSTIETYDAPIYAYTDENTLTLSFDVLVRKMSIAVYDSNNMLMYQRQISTYTQTSLDIDMSTWDSDDYTIRISYSNTNFVGEFTLE